MLIRSISQFSRISARCCSSKAPGKLSKKGPTFRDFLTSSAFQEKSAQPNLKKTPEESHPYLSEEMLNGNGQKVYLDVYGCQMNVNDIEVVWSILESKGYTRTLEKKQADIWLVMTCSIREGAENKVWKALQGIKAKSKCGDYKKSLKVGLLGCMAERLKDKMLDTSLVDIVAGPDSYRDLPRLLAVTQHSDSAAINVLLSLDETYADVLPARLNQDSVTGFVSIQRGCDNMCAYCIVPFTRGRERSRSLKTILDEVRALVDAGVKEVTLLGQNVNSYRDDREESVMIFGQDLVKKSPTDMAKGFKTIYKSKVGGLRFEDLLQKVSEIDPECRIRFTSPHPKDFPDQVLHLIASTPNICNQLHLPAQCGSSKILEAMRRGYSRESYLELVDHVRSIIPEVRFSGDMIAGFCGETDEDFEETLSLIEKVKFGTLFVFPYSLREKTHAHRKLQDNVPEDIKQQRMVRMAELQRSIAMELNKKLEGTYQLVLIEGDSKRSSDYFQSRTDGNVITIFKKEDFLKPGDYAIVKVKESNSLTLKADLISKSSILEFSNFTPNNNIIEINQKCLNSMQ